MDGTFDVDATMGRDLVVTFMSEALPSAPTSNAFASAPYIIDPLGIIYYPSGLAGTSTPTPSTTFPSYIAPNVLNKYVIHVPLAEVSVLNGNTPYIKYEIWNSSNLIQISSPLPSKGSGNGQRSCSSFVILSSMLRRNQEMRIRSLSLQQPG